jgi:hypothetical protein
MAKRYFADYMNDQVLALDEQGNGQAKQIVDVDGVRVKMRTYKVAGMVAPEHGFDKDHELTYSRRVIAKEEYDSFGKSWIFGMYPNVPKGVEQRE